MWVVAKVVGGMATDMAGGLVGAARLLQHVAQACEARLQVNSFADWTIGSMRRTL